MAGSWWGLALRAPRALQGMCLHFAEAALGAIQVQNPAVSPGRNHRSRCFRSVLPPLSRSLFSPSLLLFWNPLTRPFTPIGLLGTKQSLTVTQSTRNPSRNPAAKAVSSGNRICGNGCLCTPLLTLPLIPDTLKSPFLCTLSMTKTPEASQPSLFLYFLLSLANCCGIQSDVSHLNLDFAGEASLLLALHGEKRPKLGKSQGPANAEIQPRAPITRFPTLVVKKEQRRKKRKSLENLGAAQKAG